MTATALSPERTQRTAARQGAVGRLKKIFFPVAPAHLLMLIPAILLFTFFIIYPAIQGMFYSFTNYVGYGTFHAIGFANYKAAFSDPTIRDSYGFTLLFAVVACILTNVVALALARGNARSMHASGRPASRRPGYANCLPRPGRRKPVHFHIFDPRTERSRRRPRPDGTRFARSDRRIWPLQTRR